MKKKKRIPLIAAALSLVAPGLGQLYNGQISKGIIFFLAFFLIPAIIFLAGFWEKAGIAPTKEERCWI